ncbi:cytochrome P450 [Xylariaceae sp. AK1471]|nr:cytochrome P450 [Xylariaceae sp. AK1471]
MSSLTPILVVLCSLWIARAVYCVYFHSLSRYPGPKLAALSTSWWEWYWNYHKKGRMLFEIERLHHSYGPVIRIGTNELHVSDYDVYRDISRPLSGFTKDPYFYQFISLPGTSIGETDPARHRIRRKVLAPALSGTRVHEMAPMIESKVRLLLDRMKKSTENTTNVCMTAAIKALTMDIISRIVLGQELGCLMHPEFRSELSDNLEAAFSVGWIGPSFPIMSALALWVAERVPLHIFPMPHLQFQRDCLNITSSYLERVGTLPSQGDHSARSAVIDMLMDPAAAKDYSPPSTRELSDELTMLLTAGSDTSSNAIISGIWYICSHKTVESRLVNELDARIPSLDEEITYEKAKQLPFLTAVIKETLRLGHPLPGRLPRLVPKDGYNLHGHRLPEGVAVHTSAYILNRHANLWEMPHEFNPDRWMNRDSTMLDNRSTTFGGGARQCLGKDLAWCELWVLLANLFRRFRVKLTDGPKNDREWIDIILVHFEKKQN